MDAAWEHVLSRQPSADERASATKFLADQTKLLGSEEAALAELGRALFNVNEFLYVE